MGHFDRNEEALPVGAKTFSNAIHAFRHTIYKGPPAERMSCVVGDLNNDGVPEFVISTRNPEQLHWFGRTGSGDWEPHSLQVADFDGDGRPDIYVGEMGLTDWPPCAPTDLSKPRGSDGGAHHRHRRRNARGAGHRTGRSFRNRQ